MIKRTCVVIASLMLWGCPPPPPIPPPPSPPPTPLAPLSIVNNQFVRNGQSFALKLLSDCCDDPRTPTVDEGVRNGWPITTKEMIDKYASAPLAVRRNAIEMRVGPYKQPPGMQHYKDGYDFLPQVKSVCDYANSKGIYCYIVIVDHWTFASATDQGYFSDDCRVTKGAPPQRWQEWANAVGNTFKGLGVIYSLDNEGFRCKPSEEWERGLYNVIKSADPDAIIGSSHRPNQGFPEPGRKLLDFISMQDTFQLPMAQDIPVVLVETEGLYHPESHFRYLEANAEPGVYIGRWRAIGSDAEWAYMTGFGPDPGPACDAPDIGFIKAKHFYPKVADATPMVSDSQWCNDHGHPGYARCPYAPEGQEDLGYRTICEMEKGWPYTWSIDNNDCPQYAVEPNPGCWMNENPLGLDVPAGQDGRTVKVCAKTGVCGSVVW